MLLFKTQCRYAPVKTQKPLQLKLIALKLMDFVECHKIHNVHFFHTMRPVLLNIVMDVKSWIRLFLILFVYSVTYKTTISAAKVFEFSLHFVDSIEKCDIDVAFI